LLSCCDATTPPIIRFYKRVDCYVCELLLQPPWCTSLVLVHKSAEVHHLCTAIRPFQWIWWLKRPFLDDRPRPQTSQMM
jgi:hypothetical protein